MKLNKKFFFDNLKTIFYALIIAVFIRSIIIQPFYIPSSSMEPNLLVGDRLFVTKYSFGYSKHSFPFSPPIFKGRILFKEPKKGDVTGGVSIKGLIPGMAMHMAVCCHPLPGDRIVGIVTSGKGINVHTIDCDMLESFSDMPERWLDLSWEVSENLLTLYVGRITVSVPNVPGSLGDLSTIIAKNGGNISNLKIANRSEDFFDMVIDIEVKDVKHLTDVIAALRASPTINTVDRARG